MGTRWNRLSEAVLTSTHNLCFVAKIRKYVYPSKPHFFSIKVRCKGVFVTRTCYPDVGFKYAISIHFREIHGGSMTRSCILGREHSYKRLNQKLICSQLSQTKKLIRNVLFARKLIAEFAVLNNSSSTFGRSVFVCRLYGVFICRYIGDSVLSCQVLG